MPVRHPILNGMGRLGLGEAAAKMIDASVDTIVKEQDESPVEDMRKALEELAERENVPKVYILKEQYEAIDPKIIHQKEAEFHCVLVPVEEHEMKRIKDDAVPYTMPPKTRRHMRRSWQPPRTWNSSTIHSHPSDIMHNA